VGGGASSSSANNKRRFEATYFSIARNSPRKIQMKKKSGGYLFFLQW
jgi:hypothetical protein